MLKRFFKKIGLSYKRARRDIFKDTNLVADDIEIGFGNKIPLWLFGFIQI